MVILKFDLKNTLLSLYFLIYKLLIHQSFLKFIFYLILFSIFFFILSLRDEREWLDVLVKIDFDHKKDIFMSISFI
jgi:hypothetical protein